MTPKNLIGLGIAAIGVLLFAQTSKKIEQENASGQNNQNNSAENNAENQQDAAQENLPDETVVDDVADEE